METSSQPIQKENCPVSSIIPARSAAVSKHINRRILVIDDSRAIHDDFRKILCTEIDGIGRAEAEYFGDPAPGLAKPRFEVDSAYQGEEGLQVLCSALDKGRPYAMAFVDVRMPPGIDGIETVELLRRRCPDLQVVICTAHSDYSWEEMIGRVGYCEQVLILKKPFEAVEALQLACALCEKWELTQDARDRLAGTEKIVTERTRELREANEKLQAEFAHRTQAEAQLLRAQRLESIGTLAGGIAHDLNNMLSPILMSAQLLQMTAPKECLDLVATIETSAERAARVVRQVLTFARGIEGERLPIQPKSLTREMEKIISEVFPRSIQVDSRVSNDASLVEGDATQLHQVLLNLCVNARDAMPDGGRLGIDVADIEVDEQYASMTPDAHAGRYVRLRVSDTGAGIPKELIGKIFDPFFTTKPLGKGTGLGLSTVFGIVRSHEGFIEVHSEPGKGTRFDVFLPAVFGTAPVEVPGEETAIPAGNGELILVVEDERAILSVTQSVLTRNGYRTLTAADGAEAICIFAKQFQNIDAVFTDIVMPLMDGVMLCRALKKIDPEVRILATTGSGDENRLQELRSLDINQILGKPFATDTLLTALSQSLARSTQTFS